jgi:hypothetical protein
MKTERPLSYNLLSHGILSELDRLLEAYGDRVPHREATGCLYDRVYQDLCNHCKASAAQELEAKLQAAGRRSLCRKSVLFFVPS